jgi:GH24 family phage-related lysozyme (muramidase)
MQLPFRRPDGKPATQQEINAAWHLVKTTGRRVQNVLLPEADIDAIFIQDLRRFGPLLNRNFGSLKNIPEPAIIALYDMAFNLGGFVAFPRLRMAVLAQDWELAATECQRLGIGARRNRLTQMLFLAAGKPKPLEIRKA